MSTRKRRTSSRRTVAVYPGTFDPPTLGHFDILRRALACFDEVIIMLATNPRKTPWFTVAERQAMFQAEFKADAQRLRVAAFDGLVVDFCKQVGATAIVRGLRTATDFDYELPFAQMNRRLAAGVDTVCFIADERHGCVSSSLVKEVASFGGDISSSVTPAIAKSVRNVVGATAGKRKS